ncbi:HypC/HybG/HupF family hydrogenase formation chaperone [Desnuesiella massiliensis]|uniref:HypC/HybG/HupF family hydrogenase formation chaperone n=1 Tax=Desnuesiella massiliensis TaxID=1650662 RepID=UPI0006E3AE06|nr:HypC/HybG/HupF family hydrogenase formation chaperone [Desnuesiella massiliensis]
MCLGIALKIVEIDGNIGIGEVNGIKKNIRLDLVPSIKLGDFVMVHAGFALDIIDEATANENIEALNEVAEALKRG